MNEIKETDPVVVARMKVEGEILGPFKKYGEKLGLTPEDQEVVMKYARKVGDLRVKEMEDELGNSYYYKLASLYRQILVDDPDEQSKKTLTHSLWQMEATIGHNWNEAQVGVAKNPDKYPDVGSYLDTVVNAGYYTFQSDLLQTKNTKLAEEVLRGLGFFGSDQELSNLKNQKGWRSINDRLNVGEITVQNEFNPDVGVNVFERKDGTYSLYLTLKGDTAKRTIMAPVSRVSLEIEPQS